MVQEATYPIDLESACVVAAGKREFILVGALDGAIHVSSVESLKTYHSWDLFEGQEILKIMQPNKASGVVYVVTSELHIYVMRATTQDGDL